MSALTLAGTEGGAGSSPSQAVVFGESERTTRDKT